MNQSAGFDIWIIRDPAVLWRIPILFMKEPLKLFLAAISFGRLI